MPVPVFFIAVVAIVCAVVVVAASVTMSIAISLCGSISSVMVSMFSGFSLLAFPFSFLGREALLELIKAVHFY